VGVLPLALRCRRAWHGPILGLFGVPGIVFALRLLSNWHPWQLGLALAIITAIIVATMPGQATALKRVYCFWLCAIPFLQLSFSLFFGWNFEMSHEAWQKILLCAGYPVGIQVFKSCMAALYGKFEEKSRVEDVFEFFSLCHAALPYRFIFFSVDLWVVFLAILCVEVGFKLVVYPGQILFEKRIESLQEYFLGRWRSNRVVAVTNADLDKDTAVNLDYRADPESQDATPPVTLSKTLSAKFYSHQIADTLFAASTLTIFGLLRLRDDSFVNKLSDDAFERTYFYGISQLSLEFVVSFALPLGMRAKWADFQPMEHGQELYAPTALVSASHTQGTARTGAHTLTHSLPHTPSSLTPPLSHSLTHSSLSLPLSHSPQSRAMSDLACSRYRQRARARPHCGRRLRPSSRRHLIRSLGSVCVCVSRQTDHVNQPRHDN